MCSGGKDSDSDVSENSKYAFVDVFSALALGISLFTEFLDSLATSSFSREHKRIKKNGRTEIFKLSKC